MGLIILLSFFLVTEGLPLVFNYFQTRALNRLIAESTAESGLQYALNRIQNTCWLCDVHYNGDDANYAIDRNRDLQTCKDQGITQTGHYLHFIDQDPFIISDYQYHDEDAATECDLECLLPKSSFMVYAKPEQFRKNGHPVWNGRWILLSQGTYDDVTRTVSCKIQSKSFQNPYLLFANRWLSISGGSQENPIHLNGAFYCGGRVDIDSHVIVDSINLPSIAIGHTAITGVINGKICTSSITFDGNHPDELPSALRSENDCQVELLDGYERFLPVKKSEGYFAYNYRYASVWTGSMPINTSVKLYPDCLSSSGNFTFDYIDADNAYECLEGYHGLWDDRVLEPDYPAIRAEHPGGIAEAAKYYATMLLRAQQGLSFDMNVFSKDEGIPVIYSSSTKIPPLTAQLRLDIPELDWECLQSLAANSPEYSRSHGTGTVFDSWDEFSSYIMNPHNDLVHYVRSTSNSLLILVGSFHGEIPGEPSIFYIRKSPQDSGQPDLGCFSVLQPDAKLIINGALICETGFDLRDLDATQSDSGRYRDYTTGKDGKVVGFCGGLPLIRADKAGRCDNYSGLYRWVRDGSKECDILGFPEIPAIASQGDISIINRHYLTRIRGPIYAPNGRIFIANPESESSSVCVNIEGYLMAADIDLRGHYSIEDIRTESSSYFKNLRAPIDIISQ